MALKRLIVLSNPVAGREEAYNEWYDNQHLKDVLATEGFVGAQRFRMCAAMTEGGPVWRYLAIYDLDSDDPEAAVKRLMDKAGTPEMVISDAIEMQSVFATVYAPIGGHKTGGDF